MTELDMLEDLYDLVQAGYIEVDDDVDEPRFRPTTQTDSTDAPQDLSVPPARDRRRCEGYISDTLVSTVETSAGRPSSRELDVPLPFDGAAVVTP